MKRYVLLDRDGTLIVNRHYLSDPDGVELLPGVVEGLAQLWTFGLGLIVVTNQSGVGRGFFGLEAVDAVNARLTTLLEKAGLTLDAVLVCPHHPDDGCECRKPRPGLVFQAAKEFGFVPGDYFVIGDQDCDIELGHNLDAVTIRVRAPNASESAGISIRAVADYTVADLVEAAAVIGRLLAVDQEPAVASATVKQSLSRGSYEFS